MSEQSSAQTATVATFGNGCGGASITATAPRLGTVMQITYSGPNRWVNPHGGDILSDRPILLIGFSNQQAGPLALPWVFPFALSLPGVCSLWVSNDFTQSMDFDRSTLPPTRFVNGFGLTIPASNVFLGTQLFAQFLLHHYDSTVFPTREAWGSSNAIRAVVGT